MSHNDLSLQGEAADPAGTANQPSSSPSLQPAIPAGGPHNALGRAPPRPVFTSPFSRGLPIPAIPAVARPVQLPINAAELAKVVVCQGHEAAARVAADHHRAIAISPESAPSFTELMSRFDQAKRHHGKETYDEFMQDAPNAVALRLLAPPAGPSYDFETVETPYTNQKGKAAMGKKCGCPGCDYHNQDRSRHTAEKHVKDPAKAYFCPRDGCEIRYYDASRKSEFKKHLNSHENGNKGAQRKGRGNRNGSA